MRENCTYGSEGGEAKSLPYPYRGVFDGEKPYALKYVICVVVASRRPEGDHSSPF